MKSVNTTTTLSNVLTIDKYSTLTAGITTQPRKLLLGVALTGAKFTPENHKLTGDRILDAINAGDMIRVTEAEIFREIALLYSLGVRYIHLHARNPLTKEQTADLETYRRVSRVVKVAAPDAILSFGASRNGPEITKAIKSRGEFARVEQASLSLNEGGAAFVTFVAAIELQIVMDMERQGYIRTYPGEGRVEVLKSLDDYNPSEREETAELEVHSTSGGANYGKSSPALQLEMVRRTIALRNTLGLPHEVELVQRARSIFLTRYIVQEMLNYQGRLNVTILFGFSPRLPFPENYAAFRDVVRDVRALAQIDGETSELKLSIAVGSAVLATDAPALIQPVDVGPLKGMPMGPMERLSVYSAQPDADIDILRVGLEDTPFLLDAGGVAVPATNALLVERVKGILDAHEIEIDTDSEHLQAFSLS